MHRNDHLHRNHSLLDTLLELQTLDRVPRTGFALRGISDPESVSEHAFHITFLAWTLAAREPDLDRARVVELALVHDLAEVRTGDLPRTAAHYLPAGAKAQAESAAARDLLAPIGGGIEKLVAEYQASETREARFVSLCDKLQLLLKASVYETWGAGNLDDFWSNLKNLSGGGFSSIDGVLEELRKRRSQDTTQTANSSADP